MMLAAACSTAAVDRVQAPPSERLDTTIGNVAPVTPEPSEEPARAEQPTTEIAPTAVPTVPDSTPTPTPTPAPLQAVRIAFGGGGSPSGSPATFREGRKIPWRLELASAVGSGELRVLFVRRSSGEVAQEFVASVQPDPNVFYGEEVYVSRSGGYVMRVYADGQLIGEGSFRVNAAPEPTPRPTPRPTERPSAGGGGGDDCTPGYSPCLPQASDVDCYGGSGNGPAYTKPGVVYRVTGSDPYGLDSNDDGRGCE